MHVTVTPSGQIAVVTPAGELDLDAAQSLRDAIGQACDGRPLTVVDFAQVTFADSTILGVLVGAAKRCRAAGTRLLVVNATGLPLKVLEATGLSAAFDISNTPEELEPELRQLLAPPS